MANFAVGILPVDGLAPGAGTWYSDDQVLDSRWVKDIAL